ncbi:hypothetical protein E2C01_009668 [Portunus trituberculatus]|uniref:Uncharacterized protein n=1 Tax=Portunus trituberculatus TaxID=210409 RepID=A0A5B7D6C7_PORTR|nr:hypothetical protein [Portunus trituberculatus]
MTEGRSDKAKEMDKKDKAGEAGEVKCEGEGKEKNSGMIPRNEKEEVLGEVWSETDHAEMGEESDKHDNSLAPGVPQPDSNVDIWCAELQKKRKEDY